MEGILLFSSIREEKSVEGMGFDFSYDILVSVEGKECVGVSFVNSR